MILVLYRIQDHRSSQSMAKQFKYNYVFKIGNTLTRTLLALGIRFNDSTLITVPGRKTGAPHSTPITMVEYEGQRYLQSPFGNVDWVRNLRAAGKATLSWGRRREELHWTSRRTGSPVTFRRREVSIQCQADGAQANAHSGQLTERTGSVQQAKVSAQSPRETFPPAKVNQVRLLL